MRHRVGDRYLSEEEYEDDPGLPLHWYKATSIGKRLYKLECDVEALQKD